MGKCSIDNIINRGISYNLYNIIKISNNKAIKKMVGLIFTHCRNDWKQILNNSNHYFYYYIYIIMSFIYTHSHKPEGIFNRNYLRNYY